MAALVLLPGWVASPEAEPHHRLGAAAEPDGQGLSALSTSLMGYCLALAAGTSCAQFGIVTAGKSAGPPTTTARPSTRSARGPPPSASTSAVNAGGFLYNRGFEQRDRSRHPCSARGDFGCGVGICYNLSVILTTLAVESGGNAVVLAQRSATRS